MKISVIIPTYKPQAYIWECLDSMAAQTLNKEDFEVILVLNGCKEPYASQIREYIEKHSDLNVIFIQTDLGGVSNARNLALDVSNGQYVTFIDDDDYVSPSFLEELFEKSSANTISLSYQFIFNEGDSKTQVYNAINRTYNKRANRGKQKFIQSAKYFQGPCMKLIPISLIGNRRFNCSFKNGEDGLFNLLISDRFTYVDYTSTKAIYYRRRRAGGASYSQSIKELILNNFKLNIAYAKIYWGHFRRYSLRFYLYFVIGSVKTLVAKVL